MKITIIGGGSIGLLLAAKYTILNHTVTVVCHHREQADDIKVNGIHYIGEIERRVHVRSTHHLSKEKTDLVIVAVKSHNVPAVVAMIRETYSSEYSPDLLFIQNGMGHIQHLDLLPHNMMVGVIEHGARKTDSVTVEHTGVGVLRVSTHQGVPSTFEDLSSAEFPIVYEPDWYSMLAKKLVVNCAINPLTGIYQVSNGELLMNARFYAIMRELVKEASTVLQLDFEESWNNVQTVCKQTRTNTSSMLADLISGRPTEIDAITGVILKEAESKGIYVPYSRFAFDSIKGLEKKSR
ncbi:MAG: 2-dehydropantoate 2-reductase [Anaerobacillus sp.]